MKTSFYGNPTLILRRILCYVVCGFASVQVEATYIKIAFKNTQGTQQHFHLYRNGTRLAVGNAVSAGATAVFNWNAAWSGTDSIQVSYSSSSGGYPGTDAEPDNGGINPFLAINWQAVAADANFFPGNTETETYYFTTAPYTGPAETWCFSAKVVNATAFPITYALFNDESGIEESATVGGGQSYTFEFGNELEKNDYFLMQLPDNQSQYVGGGNFADTSGQSMYKRDILSTDADWYDCTTTPVISDETHFFAGPQINMTNTPGTNRAIAFTGMGTNDMAAKNQTLQEGFNGVSMILGQGFEKLGAQGSGLLTGQSNANNLLGDIAGSLEGIRTNGAGVSSNQVVASGAVVETNMATWAGIGQTAAASGSNTFVNLQDSIGALTNFSGLSGEGHSPERWSIPLPASVSGGSPININFNPMSIPIVAEVAGWIKVLVSWTSCMIFCRFLLIEIKGAIWKQGGFQQGQAPTVGASIAGFGFQSSLFLHLPIFVITSFVMSVTVGIGATYMSSSGALTGLLINPFDTTIPAVAEGLWLATQFVDLLLLFTHVVLAFVFHLILSAHGLVSSMVFRAMPSAILLCFLSLESEAAARVQVFNFSASPAISSAAALGGSYSLPSGASVSWESVPSDVSFSSGSFTSVWTNVFAVGDGAVKVFLSDSPGGELVIATEVNETVEQSFYKGLAVGGALFGFRCAMWVVGLLRPRGQTESVI